MAGLIMEERLQHALMPHPCILLLQRHIPSQYLIHHAGHRLLLLLAHPVEDRYQVLPNLRRVHLYHRAASSALAMVRRTYSSPFPLARTAPFGRIARMVAKALTSVMPFRMQACISDMS